MMSGTVDAPFNEEQKQYLQGFFAGTHQRGAVPFVGQTANGAFTGDPSEAVAQADSELTVYGTPIDELSKEELVKYEGNGLDVWDRIHKNSTTNTFPEGGDVFRFKFHGLFYVTPAQEAFMLRCRIPACILRADQLAGLAEISRDWGGGYVDITTRGNIQIREIQPKDASKVLMKLYDLGLTSKGSGADNVRNVTASPTSGYDTTEIIDVRPYAFLMHHTILNNRDLYGLPRKFNISFDNGGKVSVCADTNDIAFYPVRVEEGLAVDSGVYFRVQLCGITGHKQFATDSGILIKPEQAVPLACAMLRVFIEHGDRTNRKKARLKYLVDDWGIPKFLEETEKKLAFKLTYFDLDKCTQRGPIDQHGYLGVHPQKQEGLSYVGVSIPVGRMPVEKVFQVAKLAKNYGTGEIRLTVWQNLMVPNVPNDSVEAFKDELRAIGYDTNPSFVKGGIVACTGNTGCKFAAANTKGQAVLLADHLNEKLELDAPINIHLTGCPHSCAQHYIGDIGLLGAKVKVDGESVEGYHVYLGGGVDNQQGIAREAWKSVPFEELEYLLESLLRGYMDRRNDKETFLEFSRRHSVENLKNLTNEYTA